jgi:hypothetical protein
MSELTARVEPAVEQHRAHAESVEIAVQVLAQKSNAVAAAAEDLARSRGASEEDPAFQESRGVNG